MSENEKPSGTYSQNVNIDMDVRTAGGPSRSWILDRYPLTNAKEAMMTVYLNDWSAGEEAQMLSDFGIEKSLLGGAKILVASYAVECYEGHAYVLFERDGKLWEVHGSHCSCYGLSELGWDGEPGTQWQPEEAAPAAILHRFSQDVWSDSDVASAAKDAVMAYLARNN